MGEVEGVTGVHDLHLWSVAGWDASRTAHVNHQLLLDSGIEVCERHYGNLRRAQLFVGKPYTCLTHLPKFRLIEKL